MSKLESKIKIHAASAVTDAVLCDLRAAAALINRPIAVNALGIFMDHQEVRDNLSYAIFHIQNAQEEFRKYRQPTESDFDVM